MRPMTPKVNRTVRYRLAGGRWQPAQISGVVAGNQVNLRLASGATAAAVNLITADNQVNVWQTY